VSRAQRSTFRAFTPVFAGYGDALQTRDRRGPWRSRISGAPLHFVSRCTASGTRGLVERLPARGDERMLRGFVPRAPWR